MTDALATDRPKNSVNEGIVTPEAVVLDIDTAGFAPRILAGLIDLTIMSVMFGVLSFLAVALTGFASSSGTTIVAVVLFVAIFGYPIVFETLWRGRTPGKAALGLRAVNADGSPLRLKEATLRAMGGIVDKFLPPGGITGALFVTYTPRHQRVGDLVAGTIVIRDPAQFGLTPAIWFSPPPGLESFAETIDPTAITVEQYTVVRSFLTRSTSFEPSLRAAIARDLADRLARTIRHPGSTDVAPEAFLICAMARYQRTNGPGVARSVDPNGAWHAPRPASNTPPPQRDWTR